MFLVQFVYKAYFPKVQVSFHFDCKFLMFWAFVRELGDIRMKRAANEKGGDLFLGWYIVPVLMVIFLPIRIQFPPKTYLILWSLYLLLQFNHITTFNHLSLLNISQFVIIIKRSIILTLSKYLIITADASHFLKAIFDFIWHLIFILTKQISNPVVIFDIITLTLEVYLLLRL